MNFLEFINKRKSNDINKQAITEAFKNTDLDKARELIVSLLNKETDKRICSLGNFDIEIDGEDYTSELFICGERDVNICFTFNWLNSGRSSMVYSISFYHKLEPFLSGRGIADLTINTMGASIAFFIPIIGHVLNTGNLTLSVDDVERISKNVYGKNVKESKYYIGALQYTIYEGLPDTKINEVFHINESKDLYNINEDQINKDYNIIKITEMGGSTPVNDVKISVKKSVGVNVKMSDSAEEVQKQINMQLKDPEQVFKELHKYVDMVVNGVCPSVIICGAPGVGKTFKVTKALTDAGYKEEDNLFIIKGKCTTRQLYTNLYDYQNKGDIVVVDDADAVVGPHAPEDAINILKSALDSTSNEKGRLVCYGVTGKIYNNDGIEVPKRFYYNGGVIILTNYNAGQLNSALKGRSFIQDINFTTEQVLELVKNLMPAIEPETLSASAKKKAYEYLCEMAEAKEDMQISVRTFGICARIFQCCGADPKFTEDDIRSMIKEQMKLQATTTGKSY